jgi:hypothetical protein
MHSHDDALIAALAEGTIDPSQASAAEAKIVSCARCNAELRAQRSALGALRSAPAALLRDDERAALRGAVASALGLEVSVAPQPERRRRIPWGAVAVAAASLAAIVAVVPLAGLLGTAADSEDAATALAVTTVATEDDAALPREPAALEVPTDERAETLGSVEGGESQADAVPETTYAATTTVGVEQGASLTVDELAGRLGAESLDLPTSDEDGACADDALRLLGPGAVPLALPVMVDDVPGIGYIADGASSAAVFDPEGCRRLALLP